jgi:predicted TIM-barrel fold metal-dependent hydrolase
VSTITWLIPRAAFHDYLRRIVQAGFGDRVMFGTDQIGYPEIAAAAIAAIESASFLTSAQKRDIFYNNAARFLRLSPAQIARHHGN